jgi:acetyl-CoA carboxylase biotin carboxyl carrier protein
VTLTAEDVAEITRLLQESSFDEMTLELDGLRLTMRRHGAAAPLTAEKPEPAAVQVPPSQPRSPQSDTASDSITAPLLGTFYRAPKPGAPPFVDAGARVEPDTIIGIIEVMKLMNTVRAGVRGTVREFRARDGALVEYGEVLLTVDPRESA